MARSRNRRRVDRGAGLRRAASTGAARALLFAFLAAALAIAGWGAWRYLTTTHLLSIRAIRFEGLTRATADDLLALSPVKEGDHLVLADVGAMEAALQRAPWVRQVEVRRHWPPALTVKVTERRPAALVDLSGLYLVDDQAEVFKRAAPGDGLDLPVITGITRNDFLQRREAAQPLLTGALALAQKWRGDGWDAAVPLSEIHVDAVDGTTIYVGDEGTEVRLGSGDLPGKLSLLEKVLSALRAEGKRAEVLHLDNRVHPSWVTVRMASEASP